MLVTHEWFPLSTILHYRIGGVVRFLLEAGGRSDIFEALDFILANHISRLVVVGFGTNLLFPDSLFDGAVLRIVSGGSPQIRSLDDQHVDAFAGDRLGDVITFGFANGRAGLDWAGGLPGTVGAAVRGNVGAYGGELKDVLERAEVLDTHEENRAVRVMSNRELRFSYRGSLIKQRSRLVVVSASLRLPRVDGAELVRAREAYRANIQRRETRYPTEFPNCGSVFKNLTHKDEIDRIISVWPEVQELVDGHWHGKVSTGYVINRLELAGYRIGGAQISRKHANFIVNLGGARFSDVYTLIKKVGEEFDRRFGFVPESEVEIVRPTSGIAG